MQPVFRFAPSPNGALHLGHAFSALTDFDLCRRAGGRFLLRIEDIDRTRCRPHFEAAIHDDLAWLGLSWEDAGAPPVGAHGRLPAALDRLAAMGLVYPAFMSRAEIARATADPAWPRDPDGAPLYPGRRPRACDQPKRQALHRCRRAHALRLRWRGRSDMSAR